MRVKQFGRINEVADERRSKNSEQPRYLDKLGEEGVFNNDKKTERQSRQVLIRKQAQTERSTKRNRKTEN